MEEENYLDGVEDLPPGFAIMVLSMMMGSASSEALLRAKFEEIVEANVFLLNAMHSAWYEAVQRGESPSELAYMVPGFEAFAYSMVTAPGNIISENQLRITFVQLLSLCLPLLWRAFSRFSAALRRLNRQLGTGWFPNRRLAPL